jgi:alkyl sulfatase BDS1-like metallo-beta-lactamase superfamily hydrolase
VAELYPKVLFEEINEGYEYIYEKDQEKVTNPILLEHARLGQKKKIVQLNETIYLLRGYGIANMVIIDTSDGLVLIDTLLNRELAEEAKADFERITGLKKKVRAVFYTHWHADHWGGVKAWITNEDAQSGKVDVIAQDLFEGGLIAENLIAGVAMGRRAQYMYAALLGKEGLGQLETGLGSSRDMDGEQTLVLPTETFAKQITKKYGGLEFTAYHTPGETADQNSIYIKEYNFFITSDNFYDSFPNVYTIRGAKARDPRHWAASALQAIEMIKDKNIEILVRQHDEVLYEHDKIIEYLEDYHDALKYLHDQTVRLMNNGLRADEIANELVFPEKFHRHGIYEYYGSYYHSIRNVYNMYLGWYSGEPSELGEVSRPERGKRLTKLIGKDKLIKAIEAAKKGKDLNWAAELAAYLVSSNPDNQEYKNIKAEIFEALGKETINATWRNAFMTGAYELRHGLPEKPMLKISPDVLSTINARDFIDVLATKIIPDNLMDENYHINLGVGSEEFTLIVRSGVLSRTEGFSKKAKVKVQFDMASTMVAVLTGAITADQASSKGALKTEGDISLVQKLLLNVGKDDYNFVITNK